MNLTHVCYCLHEMVHCFTVIREPSLEDRFKQNSTYSSIYHSKKLSVN